MVNGVGVGNYRRIARHPPVGRCRSVQGPLYLCWDGKEEIGEEVPATVPPDRPPTGFTGAHFPPITDSPVVQFGHLSGLLLLFCFHLLAPWEELVFRGLVRWIASHGDEFRLSDGMFGNNQSFGDREVTWERVHPRSRVPPLRFFFSAIPTDGANYGLLNS